MITYSQSKILYTLPDGTTQPGIYAGNGKWKNDPTSQCVRDHGPLPRNEYSMTPQEERAHLGPSIELTPVDESKMCGRYGFFIHDIDVNFPLDSSDGCICTNHTVRAIVNGWILRGETTLTVIE